MIFLKRTKMKPLTVYSMFDGISCGRIALERAGLPVKQYFTSEIDKYASAISRCNWNSTELGDVTKVNFNELPPLDIIFCGAPCQDLSFSGKGKGLFKGDRSKLFFYFIECLRIARLKNPDVLFIVEQVKMKKEYQDTMTKLLGVEPVLINSKDFSAQSRQRLYWTNIDVLPYDKKGLFYKDIKETNVADNFYYSPKMLAWIDRHGKRKNKKLRIQSDNDKVQMIEASHFKGCSSQRFFGIEDVKGLRYITPLECERAQTVPDNYTAHGAEVGGQYKKISNTQRYKALGNGWTVDVITHLLKGLI
jgi:site-specific DNA-cytosine methylase